MLLIQIKSYPILSPQLSSPELQAVSSISPHQFSCRSNISTFMRQRENATLSFFYAIALHCGITLLSSATTGAVPANGTEVDRLALLAFRDQTTGGPIGALSTWNDNHTADFCKWEGITCSSSSSSSNHSKRVAVLNLQSRKLVGSLSPHLQNLSYLQELNLGDNHLQGMIPPELGNLINLRILNLTTNSLRGEIPSNISACKQLEYLDLSTNLLAGEVPTELTTLPKLHTLYLNVNNLTGRIPLSIGNLSSLTTLAMGRNNLQGSIPDSIGGIAGLDFLQIAENQLSGTIPLSLYNLSSLTFVTVATNQLHGSLPPSLGLLLPKLQTLYVGGNRLTGPIPVSMPNASGLINLDFAWNNFTGSIPTDLGKLGGLEWLNFEGNSLGTGGSAAGDLSFLTSLSNCTNLEVLDVDSNRLGGMLPPASNLSAQLSMLIMSSNEIYGTIPDSIGNLAGLQVLRLEENLLTGRVPHSIGRLHNLRVLSLSQNRVSGLISTTLGNLTELTDIRLRKNEIQGSIPVALGNCRKLQLLDFSHNKLDGAIPEAVISIPSISVFLSLAHNSLVGPVPRGIGNLKNLGELDISENRLSGQIPPEIGECESMEYLHMQGNLLIGSLPPALSNLKGMQYLDLSRNNLSGQVPDFLDSRLRSLWYLNLSYNDFEGLVPSGGVFKNASAISVQGNARLCGGAPALSLPSCDVQNSKRSRAMKILVPTICAVSGLSLVLCLLTAVYCLKNRKKCRPRETSPLQSHNKLISYGDLVKATNGFSSSSNLIGGGGFSTVYRGSLDGEGEVAVKVLNLQSRGASKSFTAECEALRNVRHRNLVKIMTVCSSIDSAGNEFKALVYKFMPNGSLDEWLHPAGLERQQHHSKVVNVFQRLSISMDVAAALDYLHHQCQPPVVHCDLKPSNVLLDEEMNACVGDFGLAKILRGDIDSQVQTSSIGIKGSTGYIPPGICILMFMKKSSDNIKLYLKFQLFALVLHRYIVCLD